MSQATARQCGHRCQPLVIGPVAFIRQHFTPFMCRSRCEGITDLCRPYWSEVAVIEELSSLRLAEHSRAGSKRQSATRCVGRAGLLTYKRVHALKLHLHHEHRIGRVAVDEDIDGACHGSTPGRVGASGIMSSLSSQFGSELEGKPHVIAVRQDKEVINVWLDFREDMSIDLVPV